MKKMMMIGLLLLTFCFAQAETKNKTKKPEQAKTQYKRFKTKTMQADNPHELQVILEGRRQFIPSPNDRKPSQHMLDKMQSSY